MFQLANKLYNYKFVVSLLLVLALMLSLFSFSASAEEIGDSTISEVVSVEDEIVPEEELTTNADLEQTNEYLKYITGFLLFFVICFLFWAAYKFFNLFF